MHHRTRQINSRSKLGQWIPLSDVNSGRIDTSDDSHRRQITAGRVTGLAWLIILGSPLADLFRGNHSDAYVFLGVFSLVAFITVYVYGFFRTFFQRTETWKAWAVVILLATLASAMSLGFDSTRLVTMVFVVTAASCSLSEPVAARVLVGITVLAGIIAAMTGETASDIASLLFQLVLIGIALIFLRRLIRTNAELRLAREENARLAVSEERLRFARDLHDLLGHSLSLIALKSELAGRLIETDPQRAAVEVHDIEQVTRDALREVRDAVGGYRLPTLDDELVGARAALDAAGIYSDIVNLVERLPAAIESTLGWVVREGVTNVIRHSGAQRCEVRIEPVGENVVLTIADDGHGAPASKSGSSSRPGSGLAGLRERLSAREGELKTDSIVTGGFRLSAIMPVAEMKTPSLEHSSANGSPRVAAELPL